jgi:DNA-binding NarL/FixJ family response regulator
MPLECDPYNDDAAYRFASRGEERWGLTMTEGRLLFLMCCGHTGRGDLARRSGISVGHVRHIRGELFYKTETRDTLQLVLKAWPLYLASRKEPP